MMLWILDLVMRYGLIFLLVWTPLAFGSVHAWAYACLEIHVYLLIVAWMARMIVSRWPSCPNSQRTSAFVRTPLALPLALFLTLILFQVLPISSSVLSWLSPATAELYRLFLPGWPDTTITLSLDPYTTRMALGKLFAYSGLFFLMVNTLWTPHHIRVVSWTIVGTAFVMAFIGSMQKLSGTTAIYWYRDASYAGSFFGPYINRNHFAGYQIMALFLGLGLLVTQRTHASSHVHVAWRRRLLRFINLLSPQRVLLICALAVMTGALVLSTSRGGGLSFLLGLMLLGLLLRSRRLRLKRQAIVATAMVAMVGTGLWFGMTPFLQRLEKLASDPNSLSLDRRVTLFQMAWNISQDFPLLGIGYEAFPVISARYQPRAALNFRYVHVHNDFLQLLAETGWIGFILLIGGILLVVRDIIKRWRLQHDPFVRVMVAAGLTALFAIGLHSLVDFNFHIPANALLFTTVLALTYACASLPRQKTADPNRDIKRLGRLRRVGLIAMPCLGLLAALALAFGSLRIAIADGYYPQQEILQPNHWTYHAEPAVKRYRLRAAQQWTPDNPIYWRSLAELDAQMAWEMLKTSAITEKQRHQAIDNLLRAVRGYERALHRHPTEAYTQMGWLQVVQTLALNQPPWLSRNMENVSISYGRIASLAPSNPDIQYGLGALLLGAAPDGSADITPQLFFHQAIQLNAEYDKKVLDTYRSHFPEVEALVRLARAIPNTPQAHLRAAQQAEDSQWNQARLHYRTALILSRFNPNIVKSYATALHRHQAFEEAQTLWERLRDATPNDATVYLGLAEALGGLGDDERMAQTLQQLVDRFPENPEYYARLARAYMGLGLTTEAEAAWKQVLNLQPYSAPHYVELAQFYQSRDDASSAIMMMQRAIRLAPHNIGYHHVLAHLYEQSGHRDKAAQLYQQLVTRQTTDPDIFYKLGEYARQDGKLLRAIAYYRRAVHLRPDHTGYQRALERAVRQGAKP